MYPAPNDKNAVVMFCVAKRDQPDKPRFVTDCRLRNLAVYKKQTPLPNIDELIELVAAYPVWSKIDLADGYFNIRVEEDSEQWNTIQTTRGKKRCRVMLQGDCNAPGTMMEAMLAMFKDMVYQCLVIYIDDIIIYSRTYEEHVRDVKKVLQRLQEQKFYLKESKCQFFTRKLEILGHILTSDGLHVDPKKRKTILEFPTPTRKKDLRGFLGVVNYLQRFLPGLASDASALSELQGEYSKWIWTDTHDKAFKRLKELVNSPQILRPWNNESKEPKYLICDASDVGLGSWIGQGTLDSIRPACFHSRKFNPAQLRYPTFQKELLAIIDSLHFFEAQLRGNKFVILTDHKPLLTFTQRTPDSQKLRRWQDFLMTFDCHIEHTAGKDNHIADALSRMHKYPGITTTEDDFIPHRIDSTVIRPLQEITSNHIYLSEHSSTSTPSSYHSENNMPSRGAINFHHVDCDFNKCRGRSETVGHHHSCPYLDEEDMELTSEDDYEVIKKEDKQESSEEDSLSPIPEELFEKYKAPPTKVNLSDGYYNLRLNPSKNIHNYGYVPKDKNEPVTMTSEFSNYLIKLLEETKTPILTPNSHKPLTNEELAAIVRNATRNVDSQLDDIHVKFQQHRRQHWTDCRDYYCKTHGSSHQMRNRYMSIEETVCSICGNKGHGVMSCSWTGAVLQKEKEFQANQRDSWKQEAPATTPLPVVETKEEWEIRNARIAPNTPWNTPASAPLAPQAGPSNYITAAVTTRSQNRPTKWDIAKPTPINTSIPYNRRQCAFCKKYGHNVQTCTKKRETLNDLNNRIEPSLNNIIDSGRIPNGWEDDNGSKDFFIAQWLDQGSGMKQAYLACMKVCPIWKDIYAAPEKSRKNMKHRDGFLYVQNLNKQWRLVLPSTLTPMVRTSSKLQLPKPM
jgi:hypothetical protein